jgi:hypothetical protein
MTVMTVLTVLRGDLACEALIRMIRLPPLPSRLKAISMPRARSDVWARRSRPASARGDFGQAERPSPARWKAGVRLSSQPDRVGQILHQHRQGHSCAQGAWPTPSRDFLNWKDRGR